MINQSYLKKSQQKTSLNFIRFWRGPFLYVFICLIGVNFAINSWQKSLELAQQKNLLTGAIDASTNGKPIRWDKSIGDYLERYLPFMPDATKSPLVVVAGMSQMYAINDVQPGDQIISEHLDDLLAKHGVRTFGLAAPNMNNEEALLLLMATLDNPKTKPTFFIYGVCFDKFRNMDLRPNFQRYLRNNSTLATRWREAAVRYQGRFPSASEKMLSSIKAVTATPDKKNVTFEDRIRDYTAQYIPLVASRQTLNATVNLQLFMFRNWVFNISPQSKRPILKSRYELNQEFLKMIAVIAAEEGVKPIFYIIPLNPLADTPYIPDQYATFKKWLQALCVKESIPFANFESVVPSQYWGEFMGGPDFKHFRGKGHELTARAIYNEFSPILLKKQAIR
jgi:lysophospholipase L1-like esterase